MNKIKLLITISMLFFIASLTIAQVGPSNGSGLPPFDDSDGNNEFVHCYHQKVSTGKIDQYDAVNAAMGQKCPKNFHNEAPGEDNPDCLYIEVR